MKRRLSAAAVVAAATMALTMTPSSAGRLGPSESSQESVVFELSEGFPLIGTGTLDRRDDGLKLTLHADGLDAGVYTLWWIVFNDPGSCLVPNECSPADAANEAAQIDIGNGGGQVVGPQGNLQLSSILREGVDLTGHPEEQPPFQNAVGLADASTAEVHVVLHFHGPRIPGLVGNMLQTYKGGCDHDFGPEFGAVGPNSCSDHAVAIFRP